MNYLQFRRTNIVCRYDYERKIFQWFDKRIGRWIKDEFLQDHIHNGGVREEHEGITRKEAEILIGRPIDDDETDEGGGKYDDGRET
jgi:hypothetical protein